MSKRMVPVPEATARGLRELVDRAISLADKREQAGDPIPTAHYRQLLAYYADLDQAIDGDKSKATRFPHLYGAKRP